MIENDKKIHEQESLFDCPEVSPVKTDKQSFVARDDNASILDLYPNIILHQRKNSQPGGLINASSSEHSFN